MNDREKLTQLLRNESDMAFRRRVPILLGYLERKEGERILDCGCGMGFYLKALNALGHDTVFGLDASTRPLSFARHHLGPSAALAQGDVLALPYAPASFDKVIMAEVLEHLDDDRRGITEVWRVLKPGGILALSVPHRDYPFCWDPINRTLETCLGHPFRTGPLAGIWANHRRLYRPAELVGVLEAGGFAVQEVCEHTHYCFPFIHNIVYGLGKPLVEHRWLPEVFSRSADRFRSEENTGHPLNPMNWALAVFRWVDRLNDTRDLTGKRSFMNITVKARRI